MSEKEELAQVGAALGKLDNIPEFMKLKREAYRMEFAKAALTGLLAKGYVESNVSSLAFGIADEMLAEMERSR